MQERKFFPECSQGNPTVKVLSFKCYVEYGLKNLTYKQWNISYSNSQVTSLLEYIE